MPTVPMADQELNELRRRLASPEGDYIPDCARALLAEVDRLRAELAARPQGAADVLVEALEDIAAERERIAAVPLEACKKCLHFVDLAGRALDGYRAKGARTR